MQLLAASGVGAPVFKGVALGSTGRGFHSIVMGACGARRGLEVLVGTLCKVYGCLTSRLCT